MKYALVIPDGAADAPLEQLDGKTPLEAASTPNLDRLAQLGRVGSVATTPPGMPCGSDVCSMSLVGYDPAKYHTGRAPLEAAALGIELGPEDWVFRVNCVTAVEGKMQDHSAGAISSAESAQLLRDFADRLDWPGAELVPGVGYRNLLIDRSGTDWSELASTPPHDIPGQPLRKHLPAGGPHAVKLRAFIEQSAAMLANHPVNLTRQEMGESPATHLWPWGQGSRPTLPSFQDKYGLSGAMITAVDLLAGICNLAGWTRIDVPGQTSYHDNDYAAAGRYAVDELDNYDLVCVHIEAPDEAAHAADPATKVAAIEAIDEHVVGPLAEALRLDHAADPDADEDESVGRMLVLPDHYTLVDTRKHDPTPPPFLVVGRRIRTVAPKPFTEAGAAAGDLHITHGHELMEYFLRSGLRR
ncbi:MAG: cofactor-independent phosphoglycerate mutase [Planctomycetota bacterium]